MPAILGIIKQVIGTSPGPASGLSYMVTYETPHGGMVEVGPIIPSNWHERPPDTVDVVALPVGTPVPGFESANVLYFFFTERDDFAACSNTPPPSPSGPPPNVAPIPILQ